MYTDEHRRHATVQACGGADPQRHAKALHSPDCVVLVSPEGPEHWEKHAEEDPLGICWAHQLNADHPLYEPPDHRCKIAIALGIHVDEVDEVRKAFVALER